jgi:hypothetical protein
VTVAETVPLSLVTNAAISREVGAALKDLGISGVLSDDVSPTSRLIDLAPLVRRVTSSDHDQSVPVPRASTVAVWSSRLGMRWMPRAPRCQKRDGSAPVWSGP